MINIQYIFSFKQVEYYENIYSTLGLIIITSTLFAQNSNSEDPLVGDIMKIVVELNKLELKTKNGQMLLHLCLNYDSIVDNIFTTGICR